MPQKGNLRDAPEIDLKEVILSVRKWLRYLKSKWLTILIAVLVGGIAGITYSLMSKPRFEAKTTFVLEEGGQTGSMSAFAGLSAFGMGTGAQESLFSGDNLIWLYTSNRMISETLLSEVLDKDGTKKLLIDGFIAIDEDMQKMIRKLKSTNTDFKGFERGMQKAELSRIQNKVVNKAVSLIRKDYLTIATEDHTEGIIGVSFKSPDELFSLNFVNEIVERVNQFYINTKTQKTIDRIEVLQKKVDDFNKDMNQSMYAAANAADAVPNANPNLKNLQVAPQRKVVDVQVNSAIYTTMFQQLEAAKVDLAKEAPLIRVVDAPKLPLPSHRPALLKFMFLCGIMAGILTMVFLVVKKGYVEVLKA